MCPKCKTKLKVDENKLSPQGSRFRCPKCSTVLMVKKPAPKVEKPAAPVQKPLERKKILLAHSNPSVVSEVESVLTPKGFSVITSADGIDAMVKALNHLPSLALIEVLLPKIYGFEVCKRLKERPETSQMKFILISSVHDKTKYRREPANLHGADEYVEDHDIKTDLLEKVLIVLGLKPKEPVKQAPPPEEKKPAPAPPPPPPPKPEAVKAPAAAPATGMPSFALDKGADPGIERARRLARTIINDIHLYNAAKVENAIRNNNFYAVFEAELNEGKKLYDARIAAEVKSKGDFFNEAIENFIEKKKNTP